MIENQWYAVFPSSQLTSKQPVGLRRMGLDLVLLRTGEGDIACFADHCSHRGAALSAGTTKDNCIKCPFHGIEFDTAGHCSFIPALGKCSVEDLSRFDLEPYPVREQHGILYLWYGKGSPTGTPAFFDDQIDDSFACAEMEDAWPTHYSRVIENQLDVIHVPIVHHNTIGRGNKTLINGPKVIEDPPTLVTSANNEVDVGQTPKPPSDCIIKDTNLTFIFPNIWLNRISDKIKLIAYFAPVDDSNTILYLIFYNKLTPFRPLNRGISHMGNRFNRIVERQDRRVVITQQPLASTYSSKENLLRGDGPIIAYRRIRKELKAAAGQTEREK
jgi:phenylpropionate dioxygenase-like ring-hydroxylating dioxygenase large terminal subunit